MTRFVNLAVLHLLYDKYFMSNAHRLNKAHSICGKDMDFVSNQNTVRNIHLTILNILQYVS